MFNVDHPPFPFVVFFPSPLDRIQKGPAEAETAGGEMKKCDLSRWIRLRGRMWNHEATTARAGAADSGCLY